MVYKPTMRRSLRVSNPDATSSLHRSDLSLAVYLGARARGCAALWFGSPSNPGLTQLGHAVQSLVVVDTTGKRQRARKGRQVITLRPGPLELDHDAFGLVVVPDPSCFGDSAADRFEELARLTSPEGHLVVGAHYAAPAEEDARRRSIPTPASGPSRDWPPEALRAALAAHFEGVQLVGQADFRAHAIAGLVAEQESQIPNEPGLGEAASSFEESITIDASLVAASSGLPDRIWVIAGHSPATPLPHWVVQLPGVAESSLTSQEEERAAERDSRDRELHRQMEEAIAARTREVEELRAELDQRAARDAELREAARETADDAAEDYDALESLLQERGREVSELEREVARRGVLVRDLLERQRNEPSLSASDARQDDARDNTGQSAQQRAVAAEAERARAHFEIDELRTEIETLQRREAVHLGKIRGLRSRAAELDEVHELTAGRLQLAYSDIAAAREREQGLQRELAEVRDQFELELVRVQGASPSVQPARPINLEAEVLGELAGVRARLGDREAALGELLRLVEEPSRDAGHESLRHETSALTLQLAESKAEREEIERRVGELQSTVAARDALVSRLQMDIAEQQRVARSEDERASLLGSEVQRLKEAVVAASEIASEKETLEARLVDESATHQALAEQIAQHQTELEQARQALEVQSQQHADERRLIEALQTNVSSLEANISSLESKATDSASELRETVRALAEARAILRGLDLSPEMIEQESGFLASERAENGGGRAAIGPDPALSGSVHPASAEEESAFRSESSGLHQLGRSVRRDAPEGLRQKTSEDRIAQDQDALLRSLTSQIQDRDERIARLEKRLAEDAETTLTGYDADPHELRIRLAELEEALRHEREARRAAELGRAANEASLVPPAALEPNEVAELKQRLTDRDSELLVVQGKVKGFERDLKSLRELGAEARGGLEELLGAATAAGDPHTAERIGALLSVLSRF